MDYQEFRSAADRWMDQEGITAQWYVKATPDRTWLDGLELARDLLTFGLIKGHADEPSAELVEHAQRYLDDTYDGGER